MATKPELRSYLQRYWGAQCQLVGKETLERLFAEAEKGSTKPDTWAIKKSGGTPLDVGIALSALSAGIAFLQLLFQIYDELAKRRIPNAAELKAELSKLITDANSAEGKVLKSEKGEKIIDELTR